MERLHYRSTSLLDIQAELHEQDQLREARCTVAPGSARPRPRALPFGLELLRRRIHG